MYTILCYTYIIIFKGQNTISELLDKERQVSDLMETIKRSILITSSLPGYVRVFLSLDIKKKLRPFQWMIIVLKSNLCFLITNEVEHLICFLWWMCCRYFLGVSSFYFTFSYGLFWLNFHIKAFFLIHAPTFYFFAWNGIPNLRP